MAKPILIAQVIGHENYCDKVVKTLNAVIKRELIDEYHVLIIPSHGAPCEIKFQMFFEKDIVELEDEELKSWINAH